jgi:hypothetical protein
MKRKHLFLAIAALLAASGLWFSRSNFRSDQSASHNSTTDLGLKTPQSTMGADSKTPQDESNPRQRLLPPNQTRRFTDFTPEQRVEFARRGHGPGG